jgi:hypothetical protein
VAKVALETGNFSNYRELARTADAEKWFRITSEAIEAVKAARQNGAAAKIVRSRLRRRRDAAPSSGSPMDGL